MDPLALGASAPAPAGSAIVNPSSAPLWTLEGLRGADPVLGVALLVIIAVVAGEAVRRWAKLPRACGHMLVGVLASPLALRLLERAELDPWKPLLDLAVGVLVFELGSRIRPRWLIDNPALALQSVAEALLGGAFVMGALVLLGAPPMSAALAGAVAMATSPVITMAALHESRPRGQVTERLLLLTALNSVLAVLALKTWRVLATADAPLRSEWMPVLANTVYVLCGSFLLGAALGLLLTWMSRPMRRTTASAVLQIGLLVLGTLLATQWTLSPLLALLIAGIVARTRMGHGLTVEPQLGTAGAALTVLLFVSLGLVATVDRFASLWPWVLAIIVARGIGKGIAVAALARASGLGLRQATGLTLALQPMAQSVLLLGASTYGWPGDAPEVHAGVMQAVLIAVTLMQLTGPVWAELGLRVAAREVPLARERP